ncbi:MAG: histone deacetylase [Nitrospinae bacterium]|nr:histone deacetylase [Nitrospinota bacterium]
MGSTAIFYDPVFLSHDTGPGHPENPKRLEAIVNRLSNAPFHQNLTWIKPEPATPTDAELVHSVPYVRGLEESILRGVTYLDADTVVCHDSWEAALMAAGAVTGAVKDVAEGRFSNAFCAVRPPGHHAERSRAMGFCLLNNVAIGARYAIQKLGMRKAAIVDFDVHHGNGTQDIFYDDPSVLYISLHMWPHYPGTGLASDLGEGAAIGTNLNFPMNAGAGDADYLNIFDGAIIPALRAFGPEIILVSAGFDGHREDPLGGLELTEKGYAAMTSRICGLAWELGHGRVVSALEGGYNLSALARSVEAHVGELVRAARIKK